MKQNVAIWTMVRNEDFFLRRWIGYYAQFVPRENLFILVDGADSNLPEDLHGCQVITFPQGATGPGWDRRRWRFLSHFASALTQRFDVVIGGDVDELIVLDPTEGSDPIQFITEMTSGPVISPFALEIIHRIDLEHPLAHDKPILDQRSYGRPNAFYCKPCIIRSPVQWSLGQHYSDHPDLSLSDALFLFHLRFVDRDILLDRQKQRFDHVSDTNAKVVQGVAGAGWKQTVDETMAQLQAFADFGPPLVHDFTFPDLRRRVKRRWHLDEKSKMWKHAKFHDLQTHKIPERFKRLF